MKTGRESGDAFYTQFYVLMYMTRIIVEIFAVCMCYSMSQINLILQVDISSAYDELILMHYS